MVLLQAGSFSIGRRSSPNELAPGAVLAAPGAPAAAPAPAPVASGHSTAMVAGVAVASLVVGAAGAALLTALTARHRQAAAARDSYGVTAHSSVRPQCVADHVGTELSI